MLLQPGSEGTSIQPGSVFEVTKALLEGGSSLAEAVIPQTRPAGAEQLSLFGS
ncbi:MAG: hypothetical protein HYX94_05595 [Chloroflexi bacterium]|nr:hypothetical protein [Chloroflexota bacterium]